MLLTFAAVLLKVAVNVKDSDTVLVFDTALSAVPAPSVRVWDMVLNITLNLV